MYRLCFAALVLLCQYGCAGTVTFDGAAIERMYHLFKTDPQFFIFVKHCGFLNQSHRKVLINTPILLLVGLCKRRFGHHLDAESIEAPQRLSVVSISLKPERSVN